MKNLKFLLGIIFLFSMIATQALGIENSRKKNAEEPELKVRIVLFTPVDKSFPENYMERYKNMVDYTEDFFMKWMNHWDYPCENP